MAMGVFEDLTGKQIGYWTVIERVPGTKKGARWRCQCICGLRRIKSGEALASRHCRQCANCQREAMKVEITKRIAREQAIKAMYRAQRATSLAAAKSD